MSHTLYPRIREIFKAAGYKVVGIDNRVHWQHPETKNGAFVSPRIKDRGLALSILRDAGLRGVRL